MDTLKARLKISIPGTGILSEQECSKNPKNYSNIHIKLDNGDVLNVRLRKSKTVTQIVKITDDVYQDMISDTCPSWEKPTEWKMKKEKERLDSHCATIAHDLGGVNFELEFINN